MNQKDTITINLPRSWAERALMLLEALSDNTKYDNRGCFKHFHEHARTDDLASQLSTALEQLQVEQKPETWQPIETAPKGRIVLVHYKNRLGNGRTMRARYYLEDTLESDTTESGWADEGWYEESEAYEYLMPLEGDPTHWMPLPPPPGSIQV